MKLCRRQPRALVSCAGQVSHLIVHVCSRTVSTHMFLSNLEYCVPVRMSSAESQLSLLDSVVRGAERLYEGKLCCLGQRRKVSALCLLYEIYRKADHPLNEYLHHFVAVRNTRASAALRELALVIPRCRTDPFSRSFLPVVVCLWNLLPSDMLSGGTFNSFKSAVNLCLQRA